MEKFIPYEKMSKKKKKELNSKKRKDGGNIKPVTRKSKNDYKQRKEKLKCMEE